MRKKKTFSEMLDEMEEEQLQRKHILSAKNQ